MKVLLKEPAEVLNFLRLVEAEEMKCQPSAKELEMLEPDLHVSERVPVLPSEYHNTYDDFIMSMVCNDVHFFPNLDRLKNTIQGK